MRDLIKTLRLDAHRYTGHSEAVLHCYWHYPGFRASFWYRAANHFSASKRSLRFVLSWFMHRRTMVKYGIEIPYTTRIGPGLYIGHFGGIVVSSEASLGRNVNLSQGVTIGARFRGGRIDAPVIGDRVYIGPGAKIVGACRIADGCVIGPNAVVVGDQDENAVVVGIPGRAIKFTGSAEYCVNDV